MLKVTVDPATALVVVPLMVCATASSDALSMPSPNSVFTVSVGCVVTPMVTPRLLFAVLPTTSVTVADTVRLPVASDNSCSELSGTLKLPLASVTASSERAPSLISTRVPAATLFTRPLSSCPSEESASETLKIPSPNSGLIVTDGSEWMPTMAFSGLLVVVFPAVSVTVTFSARLPSPRLASMDGVSPRLKMPFASAVAATSGVVLFPTVTTTRAPPLVTPLIS